MTCRYTVALSDFRDSMRAFRRVAPGAAFRYRLDVWILPGAGAAVVALAAYAFQSGQSWWQWAGPLGLGLLVVLPLSYQVHLRSTFRERNGLVGEEGVLADLNDERISFSIPGRAAIEYPWSSISSFCRGPHATTLLLGRTVFHTIPNRAMSPAFEGELLTRLRVAARELPC